MGTDTVTLFLCGDVMLGRGVDQILPRPLDPTLREGYVTDARTYVDLAEQVNGAIERPVDPTWPWGEALAALDRAAPDARIVNLETSVTVSDDFAPGKAVHYRMSPENLAALTAVRPDVCILANNHVADFGRRGLVETLDVLDGAGLSTAGAGRDLDDAWRPAEVALAGGGRLLVVALGMATSGVPREWAAGPRRPGVAFVDRPSGEAAAAVLERVAAHRREGDLLLVSVHWGPNWGYEVTRAETRFARTLLDGGVHLLHGHSSHHPRPVAVHDGRLVLYGCGDTVDDYEGIRGHRHYRPDLRLLFLATVRRGDGALVGLRMLPLRSRRLRLERASADEARWLAATLDRVSRRFGVEVVVSADAADLHATWSAGAGR